MFKRVCLTILILTICFVLIGSVSVRSQQNQYSEKEQMEKGNQIIRDARKEIGIDKLSSTLSSIKLSIIIISSGKNQETANTKEITIAMPDKILLVNSVTKPFESKTTSVWNGEKYKRLSELATPDGQRSVMDITNQQPSNALANLIKDKEILEKVKKTMAVDPKTRMNEELWNEIFPLILMHPFELQTEFQYIGKAESLSGDANIIDTTTSGGHALRLFFDSKNNHLLMMIEKYAFFDGDYETKYYYSNRELTDNVLIPRKIKVEHKFTPTGKEPRITFKYIEVVDFKINAKPKPNLFDVN